MIKIHAPKIVKTGPMVKISDSHYQQRVSYEIPEALIPAYQRGLWISFIHFLNTGETATISTLRNDYGDFQ